MSAFTSNSSVTVTATFASLSSFLLSYSSFSKEHIGISYEAVFNALSTFKGALFTLDYIYRGVQTALLIARLLNIFVILIL